MLKNIKKPVTVYKDEYHCICDICERNLGIWEKTFSAEKEIFCHIKDYGDFRGYYHKAHEIHFFCSKDCFISFMRKKRKCLTWDISFANLSYSDIRELPKDIAKYLGEMSSYGIEILRG